MLSKHSLNLSAAWTFKLQDRRRSASTDTANVLEALAPLGNSLTGVLTHYGLCNVLYA